MSPPDSCNRPARWSARRGACGFTLVELLVATTLLAIVALLSWRGLDSVMRSRERIVESSDELKAISAAFTQIDEDLRKSWPVRLLATSQAPVRFAAAGDLPSGQLELLREMGRPDAATQIQPVAWRLRDGVLERGFGPWRSPDAAVATEGLTWQPLLSDVVALQWQGFVAGQGWADAGVLAARASATPPSATPPASGTDGQPPATPATQAQAPITGILIRLTLDQGRQLERVISVSD